MILVSVNHTTTAEFIPEQRDWTQVPTITTKIALYNSNKTLSTNTKALSFFFFCLSLGMYQRNYILECGSKMAANHPWRGFSVPPFFFFCTPIVCVSCAICFRRASSGASSQIAGGVTLITECGVKNMLLT